MQVQILSPRCFLFMYLPNFITNPDQLLNSILENTPWEDRISARRECFQSSVPGIQYSYGRPPGHREYVSIPYTTQVATVTQNVNDLLSRHKLGQVNACFLNCYTDERKAIGWHSDDFDNMDHSVPIVVVSLGEPRELWIKEINGDEIQRQLLGSGSLFLMAPGMQKTHQHRIPKGGKKMGVRVSLTFRKFN